MRPLLLCFTLLVTICSLHFTQAGIYRRYVRRNRPRPRPQELMPAWPMMMPMPQDRFARREFQISTPWPSFLFRRARSPWTFFQQPFGFPQHQHQQRVAKKFRQPNERLDTVPHFHHQPTNNHYAVAPPMMSPRHMSTPFSAWRPMDFGNPMDRDPTFDYAPPSIERVKFLSEAATRRPNARSHTITTPFTNRPPPPPPGFTKRPSSLWKMLAHKQRPKRPFPPPKFHPGGPTPHSPSQQPPLYHHNHHPQRPQHSEEADIFPRIPNMVYFRPNDVMPPFHRPGPPHMGFPPHYHRRPQGPPPPGRPSENGSDENGSGESITETKGVKNSGNKEYLFTVIGYKGPTTPGPKIPDQRPTPRPSPLATTKKTPTVLHAVKTTPVTITTTHNTAVKPFEPTESLEYSHNHRHHQEYIDESPEESEKIEKVIKKTTPRPTQVSKLDIAVPPAPIFPNSFNILDSVKDDEDEDSSPEMDIEPENENSGTGVNEIPNAVKPRPVFNNAIKNPESESYKTSTSISVSVSKTDEIQIPTKAPKTTTTTTTSKSTTTSTSAPISTRPTTTTTEGSTTTTPTTSRPTKFPRLPTMPIYKKKPTPVYARKNKNGANNAFVSKYSSSSSSSALAKEMNGSGEIVVITNGRSKVKEYKPQFIGDANSQLLAFDKVAEGASTSAASVEVTTTPSPSTTSTKSPLQEFDPMQLLHSWFTKS